MPYSRLDIELSDKKSEVSLQAALYQINVVLDNIVDEMKAINPQYNRPSLFIECLGLTKDEHEQICDYFKNHRVLALMQVKAGVTNGYSRMCTRCQKNM